MIVGFVDVCVEPVCPSCGRCSGLREASGVLEHFAERIARERSIWSKCLFSAGWAAAFLLTALQKAPDPLALRQNRTMVVLQSPTPTQEARNTIAIEAVMVDRLLSLQGGNCSSRFSLLLEMATCFRFVKVFSESETARGSRSWRTRFCFLKNGPRKKPG